MKEDKKAEESGVINYGDVGYWESRYAQKKGERFEWLEPFSRLKPFIEKCLPNGKESTILNIGCGNSTIQEDLYLQGYHHIVNNDISAIVIEDMKQSQKQRGFQGLIYDVMDVRKMTYDDEQFDLVIDKSTLDSLMCSDNPLINVAQMMESVYRVLKNGGYCFTVSYSDSRLEQFQRDHIKFQIEKQKLTKVDEDGREATTYLYIGRKLAKQKWSNEQTSQFYSQLRQIQMKQYPPL